VPRDKTESHEKIKKAALNEFMKYGFENASMRRIAASCGMSASGLYKHFRSKEDMFSELVRPAYEGLVKEVYDNISYDMDSLENSKELTKDIWDDNEETVMVIKYIYKHYDAFKLIVCKSQGTEYENWIRDIAVLEEESTLKYIRFLKKKYKIKVRNISRNELHLFVITNINAIFQTVVHDFTQKEALRYARHLDAFYVAGWKSLFF